MHPDGCGMRFWPLVALLTLLSTAAQTAAVLTVVS